MPRLSPVTRDIRWVPNNERMAYVVRYANQQGKWRPKTFRTKKEADAREVTTRYEVKTEVHTPASQSITVAEAADLWLANGEAEGLEYSTIASQRIQLSRHIVPFIGRDKLSSLTMPAIYNFDAKLRDSGRSLATRRKMMTSLKSLLSNA